MAAIVLAAVVVLGAGIAVLVTGPIRRSRSTSKGSDIFADTTLSAAEHRRAADVAADRGEWREAVLERFRAIVRSLEERVILDERPGRTAHEAAADSAAALPGLAVELRRASTVFDDVCYGSGRATRETDAALRSLDQEIRTAKPVRATAPVLV
jgi:Flp pilus assembly protein TadB